MTAAMPQCTGQVTMEGQNKEALRIVAGNDFYLVVPLRRIVFGRDEYGDMVKRGERMASRREPFRIFTSE